MLSLKMKLFTFFFQINTPVVIPRNKEEEDVTEPKNIYRVDHWGEIIFLP